MALAGAVAGCGGGSDSESEVVEASSREAAVFDLQTTARVLFTAPAIYEARSVAADVAADSFRLEIKPSADLVSPPGTALREPASVTWRLVMAAKGEGGKALDTSWMFRLRYLPSTVPGTYDRSSGLVAYHDGEIEDFPFRVDDFQYLAPVQAGGRLGERATWLARPVEIHDRDGGGLVAVATHSVRLTPIESKKPPTQAWFCIEHSYFEPSKYPREAYAEYRLCWLVGNDGLPQGPFKSTVTAGGDTITFEGRRL